MIADLAGALSTEAIGASTVAYDPAIHSLKPFKGQRIVSDNVRHLLRGSSLVNQAVSRIFTLCDVYRRCTEVYVRLLSMHHI